MLGRMLREEGGATAIEYGLIASLMAAALIASLLFVGTAVDGMFDELGREIGGCG